jgi:subtilisin family serine protease
LTLSLRSAFGNYARPKIALIDTGYDPKSFQENSRARRLGTDHWKDFLNGSPCPLDEDGHGTSMLDILMKVAPFADICIARIAQSNQDLAGPDIRTSQQRLAQVSESPVPESLDYFRLTKLPKAIRWATEVHQAEIISLSLGWEHEQTTEKRWVANAISRALDVRDQKLLFFASASNYGGGTRELFPARHPGVFSIRATDHSGTHQSFNPSLPEGVSTTVYGTLGVGVPTLRRNGIQTPVVRTGTSPATAIAAGIAALIIAYINTSDHGASWDDVKTQAGYERLLQKLSTEPEARKQFITLEEIYHAPAALGRILTKVT